MPALTSAQAEQEAILTAARLIMGCRGGSAVR